METFVTILVTIPITVIMASLVLNVYRYAKYVLHHG